MTLTQRDAALTCEGSDEVLVYLSQRGDAAAWETLLNRYSGLVTSRVKRFFLAGAEEEDVRQEGYIGFYKAVRDYKKERQASFKTFAALCVSRQIMTAVKSSTRQKHIPLNSYVSLNKNVDDCMGELSLLDVFANRQPSDPEDIVINRERLDGIERKINHALSKLERQVLAYYLKGMTYQEIALLIDKSAKSVDNAVQRIKRKLEHVLEGQD